MQVIYPRIIPSPLEGFSDTPKTLADAVIEAQERRILTEAMQKISLGDHDQGPWVAGFQEVRGSLSNRG